MCSINDQQQTANGKLTGIGSHSISILFKLLRIIVIDRKSVHLAAVGDTTKSSVPENVASNLKQRHLIASTELAGPSTESPQ